MIIEPYLTFGGQCEEAMEFYREALGGGAIMLMRYKESPMPPETIPEGSGEKIIYSSLSIGEMALMASDEPHPAQPTFEGFSLSLRVANPEEALRIFNSLSDGGEVLMPLQKTFWSPRFGMLVDRFGISWRINTVA